VACVLLSSCGILASDGKKEVVFDSICAINLYKDGTDALYQSAFDKLHELDASLSAVANDSALNLVNQGAGEKPVAADPTLLDAVSLSLDYAALTGGAFDPAIGALTRLWNIEGQAASANPQVPSDADIQKTLPLCGWKNVTLDKAAGTIFLNQKGMALDLGGMGKGYAADVIASLLKKAGVRQAMLSFGTSSVYCIGSKKPSNLKPVPWRIAIRDPKNNGYLGVMELDDPCALSTSGSYQQFFMKDGVRYHHILDPVTGSPAQTGLVSVTVVINTTSYKQNPGALSDALSTAFFVMGQEKALAFLAADKSVLPGVDAVFIADDGSITLTDGLKGKFSLVNSSYTLKN
jgi:thiamine biosynthesis lipoprotein